MMKAESQTLPQTGSGAECAGHEQPTKTPVFTFFLRLREVSCFTTSCVPAFREDHKGITAHSPFFRRCGLRLWSRNASLCSSVAGVALRCFSRSSSRIILCSARGFCSVMSPIAFAVERDVSSTVLMRGFDSLHPLQFSRTAARAFQRRGAQY